MAFTDWIFKRNAAPQQQPVAQTQQPAPQPEAPAKAVESLPANVKAQAVEAAQPAREIMGKGAEAKSHQRRIPHRAQRLPAGDLLDGSARYGFHGLGSSDTERAGN